MSNIPAPLTAETILDAARTLVRRFGEGKTNMVDIGKALGVSHAALYRFYPSKSAVMDAIAEEAMHDEEHMASAYLDAPGTAAVRLQGIIFDLFRRKRERFTGDREIHDLYRRLLVERQDIIRNYSKRMTAVLARLVQQGVDRGEWKVSDAMAAAEVIRDSVMVYVHPFFVAQAVDSGLLLEKQLRAIVSTIVRAFEGGVDYEAADPARRD